MTPARIVSALLVTLVLTAAAALPASAKATPISNAQALAATLAAKGLGCPNFTPQSIVGLTAGTCDVIVHEAGVQLAVYPSSAQLRRKLPSITSAICKTIRSAKLHQKLYVTTGANWIILFEDKFSAGRLKTVLNAKVRALSC